MMSVDEKERDLLIELLSPSSDLRAVKLVQRLQREKRYYECRNKQLDTMFGPPIETGAPEPELHLSETDIKVILQWLKRNGAYDEETLIYSDDNKFLCRKGIFEELLNYCGHYVRTLHYNELLLAQFYNDEVDEWYFEQNADPAKASSDSFVPSEEFLFQFYDQVICYIEMTGQGGNFMITKVESLEDYGKRFGLTLDETKSKVIVIQNEVPQQS